MHGWSILLITHTLKRNLFAPISRKDIHGRESLVNSGFLKYEGVQGKEHFFGFLNHRTGSIAVDDQANVWYDHAAGKGGDIIEAVQVFENKTFP